MNREAMLSTDLSGALRVTGSLSVGGTAGYRASGSQAWFDTINGRGQANALLGAPTDFAPGAGR